MSHLWPLVQKDAGWYSWLKSNNKLRCDVICPNTLVQPYILDIPPHPDLPPHPNIPRPNLPSINPNPPPIFPDPSIPPNLPYQSPPNHPISTLQPFKISKFQN